MTIIEKLQEIDFKASTYVYAKPDLAVLAGLIRDLTKVLIELEAQHKQGWAPVVEEKR